MIAVEVHSPKGFGRVRMRWIPDVSGESLVPFICDVTDRGSEILTDGWRGYNGLSEYGYKHDRVVLSDTGDPAHVSIPGVHRVAALVKRWLLSTHQGAVSPKHLEYYLDEYTLHFNRRTSRSRGVLFYRLIVRLEWFLRSRIADQFLKKIRDSSRITALLFLCAIFE